MRRNTLAAISLSCSAGCVSPATEVLFTIDSNLHHRPLRLEVTARRGASAISAATLPDFSRDLRASDAGVSARDAAVDLPASFALVPPAGSSEQSFSVRIEARDPDTGVVLLRRLALARFERGLTQRVRVFLNEGCLVTDEICRSRLPCTRLLYCEEVGATRDHSATPEPPHAGAWGQLAQMALCISQLSWQILQPAGVCFMRQKYGPRMVSHGTALCVIGLRHSASTAKRRTGAVGFASSRHDARA